MVLAEKPSVPLQRHDRKWLALRKWIATGDAFDGHVVKARHAAQRNADAAALQGLDPRKRVHLEVEGAQTLEEVPYWLQGDAALHTDEAIDARSKLRGHRLIVDELQRWWATAQRSMQSAGDLSAHAMPKAMYMRISLLLSKAMVPSFDAREAEEAAEEDWLDDSGGEPVLERTRFMDCIFELADIVRERATHDTPRRMPPGHWRAAHLPANCRPTTANVHDESARPPPSLPAPSRHVASVCATQPAGVCAYLCGAVDTERGLRRVHQLPSRPVRAGRLQQGRHELVLARDGRRELPASDGG